MEKIGMGNAHYFKDAPNPKHEEIIKLLNANGNREKLEGMKRLIAMISKGRDVSELFPQVVKNVICTNNQVKKLVYMYLIQYAEFQQDAALLSINTFQKDLDNPNQVIRAQALRVMSSIRVKMIAQVLQLAVKKCVTDSSAYVRKTAAHAIPKVYTMDPERKEELVDCIETLLGDNTTLVLGSAIWAFTEVCPERIDLIHGHYRKICNMLADTDEWGQIYMLNLLTRYIRTQFISPNPEENDGAVKKKKKSTSFYSDEDSEEEEEDEEDYDYNYEPNEVDSDHRLALKAASPLLQSRNSGVVLAVAMLFFYCAPNAEALKVGKSLVRLIRSQKEIEYIVLQNIASIAIKRPSIFSPYLVEFFIQERDPVYVRNLKLQILTACVSESNISRILREFNYYVHTESSGFVTQVIQAIGRCASELPEVQDTCMHGLMSLLTSNSETVVAESVIVIKKLLQLGGEENSGVVKSVAKLLDNMKVPQARASIVWIVGEYCDQIPLYAPDILRKLAKSFPDEDPAVKVQILNLGSKLLQSNPQQTHLIFQYILNMAKYDISYDIRDKARLLRGVLLNPKSFLFQQTKTLFCTEKPIPEDLNPAEEKSKWALNSLSHIVGHTAFGYEPIPDWALEAADPGPRNIIPKKQRKDFIGMGSSDFNNNNNNYTTPSAFAQAGRNTFSVSESGFYSEEEEEEEEYYDSEDDEYYDSEEEEEEEYYDSEEEEEEYDSEDDQSFYNNNNKQQNNSNNLMNNFLGGGSSSPSPNALFNNNSSGSVKNLNNDLMNLNINNNNNNNNNNINNLLGSNSGGGTMDLLSSSSNNSSSGNIISIPNITQKKHILLKQVVGNGLKIEFSYIRQNSIHGPNWNVIKLWLSNNSESNISNISVTGLEQLTDGVEVIPFPNINILPRGQIVEAKLNIKFKSITKPVKFKISHSISSFSVKITPPVGELIKSVAVPISEFPAIQKRLGGMHESSTSFLLPESNVNLVNEKILSQVNVAPVEASIINGTYKYAGKGILNDEQILISVTVFPNDHNLKLKVNCDNTILGNMLLTSLKNTLKN